MKAILLAGGLGTRLRPITDTIPKCMVEVRGIPMLAWWKRLFDKHGISDVAMNISVEYSGLKPMYNWNLRWESNTIGTLATLMAFRNLWENEDYFLVAYADVLTNCDLTKMIEFHKSHEYPITVGVTSVDCKRNMREKGMVVCDEFDEYLITYYEEKPIHVKSTLANAGIYIFDSSIKYHIPLDGYDIGYHLLPLYANSMMAYKIKEYLQDIGNPSDLEKANNEFQGI